MSRTIDELLTEALAHFDAATKYAQVTDRDPRMILDAMSIRLVTSWPTPATSSDGLLSSEVVSHPQWPTRPGATGRAQIRFAPHVIAPSGQSGGTAAAMARQQPSHPRIKLQPIKPS
ncbi:MAG: hypothetical protein WB798_04880 [Nocardioidaceae bacterium]